MDIEQVREYALSLYGVTEDQPFGDDNIVFRIEGKIFLCLWLGEEMNTLALDARHKFACKLPPERNEALRERYGVVTPAFHWNKKHWSDIFRTAQSRPCSGIDKRIIRVSRQQPAKGGEGKISNRKLTNQ